MNGDLGPSLLAAAECENFLNNLIEVEIDVLRLILPEQGRHTFYHATRTIGVADGAPNGGSGLVELELVPSSASAEKRCRW